MKSKILIFLILALTSITAQANDALHSHVESLGYSNVESIDRLPDHLIGPVYRASMHLATIDGHLTMVKDDYILGVYGLDGMHWMSGAYEPYLDLLSARNISNDAIVILRTDSYLMANYISRTKSGDFRILPPFIPPVFMVELADDVQPAPRLRRRAGRILHVTP